MIKIKDGIGMCEVTLEDAGKIYEAIAANREYLQVWLPFAAKLESVKDEENYLSSILSVPRSTRELIYLIKDGEKLCGLVGFCFSDLPNNRTEIGYWLLPEYQHRGIMTECVRQLCIQAVGNNINRIQIRCATGNKPSNAIPRRLGFRHEGTERQGLLLASGEYTDIHVYSILKDEVQAW